MDMSKAAEDLRKELRERAFIDGLENVLSEYGDGDPLAIYDRIAAGDFDEDDDKPEILVWEPFENDPPERVCELIDNFADAFGRAQEETAAIIKRYLIHLATEDKLPMDFNELDFSPLFEEKG